MPVDIPGPLQLSIIRAEDLCGLASELHNHTLASIHVSRALFHLLICTAQEIRSIGDISQRHMELCLELRRQVNLAYLNTLNVGV